MSSKKNKTIFKSMSHAIRGVRDALIRERNLRVHVCIGNLICYFAVFYGISTVEWAVLFAAVSMVIVSELLNSAVEKAVDTATKEFRTDAMHSKDFAAAATLVSAIFAVLIGIALFGDISGIITALGKIFTSPIGLIVLFALILFDLYVLTINIRIRKHRRKK